MKIAKGAYDAVLTIEPVTDALPLCCPAGATQVLVEHYQGEMAVVTADINCRCSLETAARVYAEATGAVFAGGLS